MTALVEWDRAKEFFNMEGGQYIYAESGQGFVLYSATFCKMQWLTASRGASTRFSSALAFVPKTLLFWVPAHTFTFAMPPEWRVFIAAVLAIVLGFLLSVARRAS